MDFITDSLSTSIKIAKDHLDRKLGIVVNFRPSHRLLNLKELHPTLNLFCKFRPGIYLDGPDDYESLTRNDDLNSVLQEFRDKILVGHIEINYSPFVIASLLNCRKFIFRCINGNEKPPVFYEALLVYEIKRVLEIWQTAYPLNEEEYVNPLIKWYSKDPKFDYYDSLIPVHLFLIGHEIGHLVYNSPRSEYISQIINISQDAYLQLRRIVDEIYIYLREEYREECKTVHCSNEEFLEELFSDIVSVQFCSQIEKDSGSLSLIWTIYSAAVSFLLLVLISHYLLEETGLSVSEVSDLTIHQF